MVLLSLTLTLKTWSEVKQCKKLVKEPMVQSMGSIKKPFKTKEMGNALFSFYASNSGPVIIIQRKEEMVMINFAETRRNQNPYQQLPLRLIHKSVNDSARIQVY